MKIKFIAIALLTSTMISCGGSDKHETSTEHAKHEETSHHEEAKPEEHHEEKNATVEDDGKGVGPVTSVEVSDEIDEALAEKGKELFKANCVACHKIGKRFVGPALKGVTQRRKPEWIMNMILNPEGMVAEDPTAKALLQEYSAPMANQSLTEDEARAIYEFFRTKN